MEEKERYKWSQDVIVECPYEDYDYIVDTENNIIFSDDNYFKLVDLLNQQDKEIKKLEEYNNKYPYRYSEEYMKNNRKLETENQQLKQQLAESEKNFIIANNLRKNSNEVLLNYKTEKYGLDKTIQELRKIKLSFPEKEWYYKGFENCERQMSSHIADLTLQVKELKQRLHDLPKKIVEEIKLQLFNHFKVKNIEEYEKLPLIDSLFTADTVIEILDTILKKFGGRNEK